MSLFVRVVAHYGSNESNDSLRVFSVESLKSATFCFLNYKSEYFHLCTTLGGDDYIGHPPVKYSKSMPMLLTDP